MLDDSKPTAFTTSKDPDNLESLLKEKVMETVAESNRDNQFACWNETICPSEAALHRTGEQVNQFFLNINKTLDHPENRKAAAERQLPNLATLRRVAKRR